MEFLFENEFIAGAKDVDEIILSYQKRHKTEYQNESYQEKKEACFMEVAGRRY